MKASRLCLFCASMVMLLPLLSGMYLYSLASSHLRSYQASNETGRLIAQVKQTTDVHNLQNAATAALIIRKKEIIGKFSFIKKIAGLELWMFVANVFFLCVIFRKCIATT